MIKLENTSKKGKENTVNISLTENQIKLLEKINRYTLEMIEFYELSEYTTTFHFGSDKSSPSLTILRVNYLANSKFAYKNFNNLTDYPNATDSRTVNDMVFLERNYSLYSPFHKLHGYFISGYQSKDINKYYFEKKDAFDILFRLINDCLIKIRTYKKTAELNQGLSDKEKEILLSKLTNSSGPIG